MKCDNVWIDITAIDLSNAIDGRGSAKPIATQHNCKNRCQVNVHTVFYHFWP